MGLYPAATQEWRDAFPPQSFFIISVEEYERDAAAVLLAAYEFLGVGPSSPGNVRNAASHHWNRAAPPPSNINATAEADAYARAHLLLHEYYLESGVIDAEGRYRTGFEGWH
eukprot:TRINITY_DN26485_c0_g1_i1.p2 TRINITY_DN26485_c0_g1~~TRINITY_DN26485_c0_g1_i1.p2  ORF type:complete len:120 (+),score=26.11 TRINITY_DN26485_c0_g1_i1:25-360(+)